MAWVGPALEKLRSCVPDLGGYFDAASAFRALGRQLRLRYVGDSRLAYHHLPALLRRRCYLFRIRLRDDPAADRPLAPESPEPHHDQAPGEYEQDHPGDRLDRRLRVCH